jgi:hypothetical protein
MNHRKISGGRGRYRNARDAFGWRRQGREKRERQMAHRLAEFGPMKTVPGIDGVEAF